MSGGRRTSAVMGRCAEAEAEAEAGAPARFVPP
jgi:hypothetical protein